MLTGESIVFGGFLVVGITYAVNFVFLVLSLGVFTFIICRFASNYKKTTFYRSIRTRPRTGPSSRGMLILLLLLLLFPLLLLLSLLLFRTAEKKKPS